MKDHHSDVVQKLLQSSQEELLESFQFSLYMPPGVPPRNTKLDETQKTSLGRGLVELSGGRVYALQHRFAEKYTASENADLCASLLGITRTVGFGDIESKKIHNTLSMVLSKCTINVQEVEERTMKMMDHLRIGFPDDYLVRCQKE